MTAPFRPIKFPKNIKFSEFKYNFITITQKQKKYSILPPTKITKISVNEIYVSQHYSERNHFIDKLNNGNSSDNDGW